jgi:antitoxin component HigA of HigAB toxin-antitoxin module
MTAHTLRSLPADAPEGFNALCMIHMPRAIHDKTDFENTVQVMDWIAVRAHTEDQYDYAETLAELVTVYEETHGLTVDFNLSGIKLLKELVKQSRTTQKELSNVMGIDQSAVSKILAGTRNLTRDHAKRLAKHFSVKAAALLEV